MGMIVTTPMLSKGQNAPLPEEATGIDVVLGWTESDIEVDASALLLGAGGKVGSDADFVFYNQPESADGSVRFLGRSTTEDGAQARDLVIGVAGRGKGDVGAGGGVTDREDQADEVAYAVRQAGRMGRVAPTRGGHLRLEDGGALDRHVLQCDT